jgi:hypothetical protein
MIEKILRDYIITFLKRYNYEINDENQVKVLDKDTIIKLADVKHDCDILKASSFGRPKNGNQPILVYTCTVPDVNKISNNEEVNIIDRNELKHLSLHYKNYAFYDLL